MREANHILSVVVEFFLQHPFTPAYFCAAVFAGLLTADVVLLRRRRN